MRVQITTSLNANHFSIYIYAPSLSIDYQNDNQKSIESLVDFVFRVIKYEWKHMKNAVHLYLRDVIARQTLCLSVSLIDDINIREATEK